MFCFAEPIDIYKATQIALNFRNRLNSTRHAGVEVSLLLIGTTMNDIDGRMSTATNPDTTTASTYYIFNIGDVDGFIITSGADCLSRVRDIDNKAHYKMTAK